MQRKDAALRKAFATPGRCQWCGKNCQRREGHHLWTKGMGGGSVLDLRINLIALGSSLTLECPCHTKIHSEGKIHWEMLLQVVASREKTTPARIEEVIRLFQRLPKETTEDELAGMGLLVWTRPGVPVAVVGEDWIYF